MLDVRAIDTYYGETQVLFGVSLRVAPGEIVALLGPSGAGKTTTLRSILGLTPARSGRRRMAGPRHHPLGHAPDLPPRHQVGTGRPTRLSDAQRRAQPLDCPRTDAVSGLQHRGCCEIFPALRNLLPRECENMSGGELQMVSISRALAGGPGVILFDEPSQGLAPKVVQDVVGTLRSLRDKGVGALVVDQNVRIVLDVADRVYVMHAGRIVHEGEASALRADRPRATRARVGGRPMSAPALKVEGLVKRYYRSRLARAAAFTLAADFTVAGAADRSACSGPNGSGKTTLFELITGSNVSKRGPCARGRPRHPPCSLRRARPPRDPLSSVLPGSRVSQDAHGVDARAGAAGTARSSTCSTSRSSRSRMVTSASCCSSSAACATRETSSSCVSIRTKRYHLEVLAQSCERFLFVHQGTGAPVSATWTP